MKILCFATYIPIPNKPMHFSDNFFETAVLDQLCLGLLTQAEE